MPDMDTGQVRAFVAAAEHGNFTQAAAALFVSQQALSKRIAALERLGGPLFERHAGGVRLTDRGRALLPVARSFLDSHDAVAAVLRDAPAATLRADVWGSIHVPAVQLARFTAAHPDAPIAFSMRKSLPDALRALRDGDIDIAFGNVPHLGSTLPDDVEAEPLLEEVIAGLVGRDDPLGEVTLAAARERGFFFPATGAAPELVNYMRWVGELLGVEVCMSGSNASLVVIHDLLTSHGTGLIGMTGRDWPMPAAAVKVIPAPIVPPYQWWLVRRRGWSHPTLERLRGWLATSGAAAAPR